MEICCEPHLWYILISRNPWFHIVSLVSSDGSFQWQGEEWKPAMPRKHIPHSIGIKRKAGATYVDVCLFHIGSCVTSEDIRCRVDGWFLKVEDLPDINTLYEPRELAQLFVGRSQFVESC